MIPTFHCSYTVNVWACNAADTLLDYRDPHVMEGVANNCIAKTQHDTNDIHIWPIHMW